MPLNAVRRRAFGGSEVPPRGLRAPGTAASRWRPGGTVRIARIARLVRPRAPSRVDFHTRSDRASGAARGPEDPPLRAVVPRTSRGGPIDVPRPRRPGREAPVARRAGGPWSDPPRAPHPPPRATDTRRSSPGPRPALPTNPPARRRRGDEVLAGGRPHEGGWGQTERSGRAGGPEPNRGA